MLRVDEAVGCGDPNIATSKGFHVQLLPADILYGTPFVDWIIVTQDRKAGTRVKARTTVWISASPNGRRVQPSAQNVKVGAVLKRAVSAGAKAKPA